MDSFYSRSPITTGTGLELGHSESDRSYRTGGVRAAILPHRACEECKRKKTKCDMTPPMCSTCRRAGSSCVFPTTRKRPFSFRRHNRVEKTRQSTSERDPVSEAQEDALLALVNSSDLPRNFREVPTQKASASGLREPAPVTANGPSSFEQLDSSRDPKSGRQHQQHTSESGAILAPTPLPDIPETLPQQWMLESLSDTDFDFFDAPLDFLAGIPPENFSGASPNFEDFRTTHSGVDCMQYHDDTTCTGERGQDPLQNERAPHVEFLIVEKQTDSGAEDGVILKADASIVRHLVDLYFKKLHGIVPIINRPNFMTQRLPQILDNIGHKRIIRPDDALLIYGILSLAARFSNSEIFKDLPRKQRGLRFAREAGLIILRYLLRSDFESASLTYLQGLVLCTFYWLASASGPNGKAWFLTGVCCHMAHLLGLEMIDYDIIEEGRPPCSATEWAQREELRRVWWAVVEADIFASFISCRPSSLDRNRMHVLLPSSDEHWFLKLPRQSAFLNTNATTALKDLKTSGNRNPHAWYLLANQLMLSAHEMSLEPRTSRQRRQDLENAIQCFELSLPEEFELGSGNIAFEEGKQDRDNRIIALHLILQSARACLIYLGHRELKEPQTKSPYSSTTFSETQESQSVYSTVTLAKKYRPVLSTVLRAVRAWSPEYIALCSPFTVCMLVGPHAAILKSTAASPDLQQRTLEQDLLQSATTRFAEYWDLGSAILELVETITLASKSVSGQSSLSQSLAKRFAALIPPRDKDAVQRH